jgi:DNA mismatch repair protein MutL
MGKIKVLDQNTINQIAAGEVIERPASVVKELLENAIDAGATAITVEISDGGKSLIRITDNGSGIDNDDVRTAFLPHATSKIKEALDLVTVSSLGFRGEALASIASIAKVELITKVSDSFTGIRYVIEGGEELEMEEIGAPEGTTFIIKELFFNTPARRKFLKAASTEAAHIADFIEKIALSHPDVSFRFINNKQNKLHTTGNHNIKDMIYTVFGRDVAAQILPVEHSEDQINITGFIGKPAVARGNRGYENYFINGRYIKSGIIYKAIEEAFSSFMMNHKYPFALLYINIDSELIDVNVHPAKLELRFTDSGYIFSAVYKAVKTALSKKESIITVGIGNDKKQSSTENIPKGATPEPFELKRLNELKSVKENSGIDSNEMFIGDNSGEYLENNKSGNAKTFGKSYETSFSEKIITTGSLKTDTLGLNSLIATKKDMEPIVKPIRQSDFNVIKAQEQKLDNKTNNTKNIELDTSETNQIQNGQTVINAVQEELFDDKMLSKKARHKHKIIGQVFATYWLVEYNNELYIIDQHAAHEKVLYEQLITSFNKRTFTSQMLNPPIIITLSMYEEEVLESNKKLFEGLGFEIEHFGGKEYAVRAVPDNLFNIAKQDLLIDLIDSISVNTGIDNSDKPARMICEKAASMSCKAAVKGNNNMSLNEVNKLIDELLDMENPYACPHGRPTIIKMSKYELEKKFKRVL